MDSSRMDSSPRMDCPICMDCIETTTKNCVTTNCGHCFHTNCLMQNVAHNGFACPYCRAVMAEKPQGAKFQQFLGRLLRVARGVNIH